MKPYSLTFIINGETINKRNADIDVAFMAVKPELVLTEMYVTAKRDKSMTERKLTMVQARKIFNDAMAREVFINNLQLSLSV